MNRNAWQLFSNDLYLAEKTLQTARSSPGSFRETASLAQHLTFFGHFDQAQDLLLNSPAAVLRETYGRAALFRIRQYRRHPNPWLSLCLREDKPLFENLCHRIKTSDITIQVKLGAGLGDMLETIALRCATLKSQKNTKRNIKQRWTDGQMESQQSMSSG